MKEHISNEIFLPLASVAFCVLVLLIIMMSVMSCIPSTPRDRSFKYVLLNVKPDGQDMKKNLYNKVGLSASDDIVHLGMDKIFIETKHKLTNQQWRDCESLPGHRLILVHQVNKSKVQISENFKHEIQNVGCDDGLKIKCVSDKEKGEKGRQNYERVQIEGNWLDITLHLDRLAKGNYVEREQDQGGSFSLAMDDEYNKSLLQGSYRENNKSPKKQKSKYVEENCASSQCIRNRIEERLEIENQFYDYALEHCKDRWQRIIRPEPFDCIYKAGSLVLTGQACMVSKAAEDLADLFRNLTTELSESTYTLSEGIDVEAFKTTANLRIAVPMKTLIQQQSRNGFKLFGPRDRLAKVKEMLKNLDKELAFSSSPVQPVMINGFVRPEADKPIGSYERFSNEKSHSNTNFDAKKAREIPGLVAENSQLSRIKVSVIKGDLIKQNTDVIVNPANESLEHGGGASKAIANAAGRQLLDECRKYIENNGGLQVGQVMHTTAGNLRPRIKFVIHAVGPSARRYPDEKVQKKIVEETFFNCFKYANDQLRSVSISIPAISSGILGIDKDVVARSAFAALKRFEEERSSGKRTLKKVNFVNIDDESTQAFLDVSRSKQSYTTEMKSFESNEEVQREVKRDSKSADQPKRKRVLVEKQSSAIHHQDSEANKSSKLLMNFEKVNSTNLTPANDDSDDSVELEDCVICMESITDPEVLPCGHKFCKSCIKDSFDLFQPKCPSCGRLFGMMRGNQPQGTMNVSTSPRSLTGYEQYKTIVVQYDIPNGTQDERHPNPGEAYKGTQRHAYLPDNAEGQEVCKLLKKAFDAGLIFTVGRSSTTGRDNRVIWNDIHHKTSEVGTYGYPDQLYLSRVKEELKAKGLISTAAADGKFSAKQSVI